ncbi:hypothetical protein IPN35_03610 [Candidatus Peregrinibacteria bacterium]|nr:MAG: hypothetical protein IPN35_03610 [Candidatus Peregrinibacteria bacterium]
MISKKYLAASVVIIGFTTLAFVSPTIRGKLFSADFLFSHTASFHLWFLKPEMTDGSWSIPNKIGAVVELPLGMVANETTNPLPIDSVEFQILGVPSELRLDSVSLFPGFHVDTQVVPGETPETNTIHLFVSPEEFTDPSGGTPGAPISGVEKIMSATDEVLRVRFRVVSDLPSALPDIALRGILTARDGDFTRYTADGNLSFPGNNPGTIHPVPIEYEGGSLQIVSTMSYAPGKIRLEFSAPPLSGAGGNSSERPENYYVYVCGSHVPAPTSADSDLSSCHLKTQGSISDPGVPATVTRETNDPHFVDIHVGLEEFISGAYYIVRVENVSDELSGNQSLPPEGIFSQMFRFVSHPTVATVETLDDSTIRLTFSADLCPANSEYGAGNLANYEILSCNSGASISECLQHNETDVSSLGILSVSFDGARTVLVSTETQEEGAWYIFRLKKLRNVDCLAESELSETPPVYGGLFAGYPGNTTEENTLPLSDDSGSGAFVLTLSDAGVIHLPWRETLSLRPSGGTAPFSWAVIPPEAGTLNTDDPQHILFTPVLSDENGTPLHDQRDILIRATDSLGEITEIPVHILRRGDLGGAGDRFLDKTDINDINDVSAGWGS